MNKDELSRSELIWKHEMEYNHALFEIKRLQAENASLRARLDKAVEIPIFDTKSEAVKKLKEQK